MDRKWEGQDQTATLSGEIAELEAAGKKRKINTKVKSYTTEK